MEKEISKTRIPKDMHTNKNKKDFICIWMRIHAQTKKLKEKEKCCFIPVKQKPLAYEEVEKFDFYY